MYRGPQRGGAAEGTEEDYAFQFEAPHLDHARAPLRGATSASRAGAFAPLLRRVDEFLTRHVRAKACAEREARAEKVREADAALADVVAQIKKRGIRHPFVKNYVLARTTPADPGAQDPALLRPDLREPPGEHRGLRPGQGPPGRDRPRCRLRGPGLGATGRAVRSARRGGERARGRRLRPGQIARRRRA